MPAPPVCKLLMFVVGQAFSLPGEYGSAPGVFFRGARRELATEDALIRLVRERRWDRRQLAPALVLHGFHILYQLLRELSVNLRAARLIAQGPSDRGHGFGHHLDLLVIDLV